MCIFDSYRRGCVELWGKKHGLSKASIGYPPSFNLHLKDPHSHLDMIEAPGGPLQGRKCRFRTIFGGARRPPDSSRAKHGREDRAADALRRPSSSSRREGDGHPAGSGLLRLDRLPAHGRWLRGLQLLLREDRYGQGQDPGHDGSQRRHVRIRTNNAAASV
jgi:hypothetical protein